VFRAGVAAAQVFAQEGNHEDCGEAEADEEGDKEGVHEWDTLPAAGKGSTVLRRLLRRGWERVRRSCGAGRLRAAAHSRRESLRIGTNGAFSIWGRLTARWQAAARASGVVRLAAASLTHERY